MIRWAGYPGFPGWTAVIPSPGSLQEGEKTSKKMKGNVMTETDRFKDAGLEDGERVHEPTTTKVEL